MSDDTLQNNVLPPFLMFKCLDFELYLISDKCYPINVQAKYKNATINIKIVMYNRKAKRFNFDIINGKLNQKEFNRIKRVVKVFALSILLCWFDYYIYRHIPNNIEIEDAKLEEIRLLDWSILPHYFLELSFGNEK